MCKLLSSGNQFSIESYYNQGHQPIVVDSSNRTVGLRDAKLNDKDGVLMFSFRREIKIDRLHDKFFNLNAPFFLLVASGRLKENGK
jgi:hypothetical protein